MQDPPASVVFTNLDRELNRRPNAVRIATVRFSARATVEMVHLTEPKNAHRSRRWRRIGNPTSLVTKVLLLSPSFIAANMNLTAADTQQS